MPKKFVGRNTYKRKCNVCKKFLESQGNLPVDQSALFIYIIILKTLPSNSSYNEHREETVHSI